MVITEISHDGVVETTYSTKPGEATTTLNMDFSLNNCLNFFL